MKQKANHLLEQEVVFDNKCLPQQEEQERKHLPTQEGVVLLQLDQVTKSLLKQEVRQQEVKTHCWKEKLHQDEREGLPREDLEKLRQDEKLPH